MAFKEVTALRKSGKLEQALEMHVLTITISKTIGDALGFSGA